MEPIERHAWKQLAGITALALAIRLLAAAYWQAHWPVRFFFGDSQGYWDLSQAIAHGRRYMLPGGEQIFRTPGYPLLLSPIAAWGEGPAVVFLARVENCMIGSLSAPLAYVWARRLFSTNAAQAAAWIAALYPEAIATNVAVLSDTPLALLSALFLIVVTAAWQRIAGKDLHSRHAPVMACHFAIAGALAGLTTLVHPSFLLFVPFMIGIGLLLGPLAEAASNRTAFQVQMRHAWYCSIMLSALCLVMLPWWIRNICLTGRFVPTTLQVGASLYDGWNPLATGGSDMRFVADFRRDMNLTSNARVDIEQEQALDRNMRAAALDWAYRHFAQAARLAGIKFLRMWNIWPNEPSFSFWPIRLAVVCGYGPVIVLALWSAWKTLRRGWVYWLCWLPAVYFTLLHTVFVSSLRYRQPAMLGLIVLAAGAVDALRSCRAEGTASSNA